MYQIKYTKKDIFANYVDISIINETIIKSYNKSINYDDDDFDSEKTLTPYDSYKSEKKIYERINNVNYTTKSGTIQKLTPIIYEIGENYISMEKYDLSLRDAVLNNKFSSFEQLLQFMDEYIVPIAMKLDELKISHNDFYPRNIVCSDSMNKVSIIDFELSYDSDDEKNIDRATVNKFLRCFHTLYPEQFV
jgi:tRNA A-37 threonylcarbamoyl transferase component Bud32